MYLFSFTKFAGQDRVFKTDTPIGNPGDLLKSEWDVFLNLWTEISFPELYHYSYPITTSMVIYPQFFDQHFLSFLHWMVYERYTSYKSVIKYFVSMDIQDLLAREVKSKAKKKNQILSVWKYSLDPLGQNLIIFPDNRSRYTMLSDAWIDSPEIINLLSTDTQNRKDINWRNIKKGAKGPIIATQSEVFQPYAMLKKILFVDPHKWYYNNQQDPRYSLSTVVKKMWEIYWAEIEEVSFQKSLIE